MQPVRAVLGDFVLLPFKIDQAAAQLAQDNCELACCFIQKTAVEKAGPEMDKRLATVSV